MFFDIKYQKNREFSMTFNTISLFAVDYLWSRCWAPGSIQLNKLVGGSRNKKTLFLCKSI